MSKSCKSISNHTCQKFGGGEREAINPAKKNQWQDLFPFPFSMEYFNIQPTNTAQSFLSVTSKLQEVSGSIDHLRKIEMPHAARYNLRLCVFLSWSYIPLHTENHRGERWCHLCAIKIQSSANTPTDE